jgi:hypothetical protein
MLIIQNLMVIKLKRLTRVLFIIGRIMCTGNWWAIDNLGHAGASFVTLE